MTPDVSISQNRATFVDGTRLAQSGFVMKLAMAKKQTAEQKVGDELEAQLVRLSRQNAVLRKEIARLQVYRAMAYRDPLTGLWNRRYFEERLKEEFSRSQRAGAGRKFSILVIDINDFKDLND